MTNKISKEEMELSSKLKTEKALIELGTSIAENKFKKDYLNLEIKNKETEITKVRSDLHSYTKKNIVTLYEEYIILLNKLLDQRHLEYKKINNELKDVTEENKLNILELVSIENTKNERIIKLREKCSDKNKKIKFLSIFGCLCSVLSFFIGYTGFIPLVNNIYGIISRIINIITILIYHIVIVFYWILTNVINNIECSIYTIIIFISVYYFDVLKGNK